MREGRLPLCSQDCATSFELPEAKLQMHLGVIQNPLLGNKERATRAVPTRGSCQRSGPQRGSASSPPVGSASTRPPVFSGPRLLPRRAEAAGRRLAFG